ncbi:MAG: LysR family transcriptional regulator [Chloroflexi bacterium]|nr:LysR family transcriptional regulator [Chloroflexota bacterium]
MLRPRVKVWIEGPDGRVALSEWRVALLEAVECYGSLSAAARGLGIPQRTAWQRLHEMEERLGTKLIEGSSGGASGGSSQLTAAARAFIQRYQRMRTGLDEHVQARFLQAFDASIGSGQAEAFDV